MEHYHPNPSFEQMLPTLRAIEDNLPLGASLGLGGARQGPGSPSSGQRSRELSSGLSASVEAANRPGSAGQAPPRFSGAEWRFSGDLEMPALSQKWAERPPRTDGVVRRAGYRRLPSTQSLEPVMGAGCKCLDEVYLEADLRVSESVRVVAACGVVSSVVLDCVCMWHGDNAASSARTGRSRAEILALMSTMRSIAWPTDRGPCA